MSVRKRISVRCLQDPTSVKQVFGTVLLMVRICRYLRPALSWVRGRIERDLHDLQEIEFNMDDYAQNLRETEPKTQCNGAAYPTSTSTALPNVHPESEIRERQDGFSRKTTVREADVSIHFDGFRLIGFLLMRNNVATLRPQSGLCCSHWD